MIPVEKKKVKGKLLSLHTWLACNVGNKKKLFSLALKNTSVIVFSDSVNAHEVISRVNRSVYKSQLPANFTSWKRPYHLLKLFKKTKTWDYFEDVFE